MINLTILASQFLIPELKLYNIESTRRARIPPAWEISLEESECHSI